MDYINVSTILAFDTCDTRQCTEIPIVDDMIVELTESFFVTLERTPGLDSRITLDPVDGEIEITDDDGVYMFPHMQVLFMYMRLTSQRLWWVWRGHPIQSLRVWVRWRCVLLYTVPVSPAPLITTSMSDSQLMMILQVMCYSQFADFIYFFLFALLVQCLPWTMVLCLPS